MTNAEEYDKAYQVLCKYCRKHGKDYWFTYIRCPKGLLVHCNICRRSIIHIFHSSSETAYFIRQHAINHFKKLVPFL